MQTPPGGASPQEQAADRDQQAMELIRSSGVLNPSMTLDQVMALTQRLSALEAVEPGAVAARHTDTFIHRHFIFKHEE
jgi:hypothetical protein